MTDSRVAQDPNRLPWLAEERAPRRKGEWSKLLLGALVSALLVAGVSFWLGARNATEAEQRARPAAAPPATVTLPPPLPAVEQPRADQVVPAPVPVVRPLPEPTVRIVAPQLERKAQPAPAAAMAEPDTSAKTEAAAADASEPPSAAVVAQPVAPKPAVAKAGPMRLWPAMVSDGANGRVVRIGAYGSRLNAKKGWKQIISRYPGMRRLKAVVAPVPAPRTGRTYYRLQFGTTSQAHSEVLCQRMRAIRKTCAVVGLPERTAPARAGARR
ncbi:MAG: SPOR domain-containing protein [Sphingomicrobium sp.]